MKSQDEFCKFYEKGEDTKMILSNVEEEILKSILNHFVKNDNNFVRVTYDVFPKYAVNSINSYLDNLKYKTMISNYNQTLSDVDIYLTPDGINYFINKKKQIFPKDSMDLLHQLLEQDNPVDYMQFLFKDLDTKMDNRLRAMMRDLREKGYIVTSWADNIPHIIEFNDKAYMVDENCVNEIKQGTYIINNITNGNANINSTDNSVRNTNISNNEAELFTEMLRVASDINENNKKDIIKTITDMKDNYDKPGLKEKYYKFIEVAASHMSLFAPFIPLLTEMIK